MDKSSKPEQQKGQLPAPYTNPWVSLRQVVAAVFADLCLRLRELWRRNWQGELFKPGFWPSAIAALFWPFLLASVIVLAISLTGVLIDRRSVAEQPDIAEQAAFSSAEEVVISTPPAVESQLASAPLESPELESTDELAPFNASLQVEPLLMLLTDEDLPDGLLLAAEPRLLDNELVLRLSSTWTQLSPTRQSLLTDRWQALVEELGYDELQLQDEDGHLLARTARVGLGMIVFDQDSA